MRDNTDNQIRRFKKPKNKLEATDKHRSPKIDKSMFIKCEACKKTIDSEELKSNYNVCPICGAHHRIGARAHIMAIVDEGSFQETDTNLSSSNVIDFPQYEDKLASSVAASNEKEAVITGFASVGGTECAIFAMEPRFMMASMGTIVGEKLTRLFETATQKELAVTGFVCSGGARMQEGILSLMQMAKVNAAAKRHSDAGLFYMPVLCDPTAGGVTASFAMCGDIIAAEPKALICFAGPRVIEQTIRQKLPNNFQTAEFLLGKGFVDIIVARTQQRDFVSQMLAVHSADRTQKGRGVV